ncbi:Nop16p [Sugiyamaella lignohabitans]|uniref:Nucleolar protein 16 n=1 Tax=Sugiyamaella lignohabitans TaxID=796027 RepID=A0A167E228_9ASCO|nr:Nop16p [Sugiyamaella lignohabitans]ANB13554.1 Nop16p [Sugiyamaella lignohabitans]
MPSGVRRKKHARSKLNKNTRRVKDKHAKINIQSNAIIAEHWDSKLTLAQNYKKLGLTARLGRRAGGEEKEIRNTDSLNANESDDESEHELEEGEGRIVRHEDGSVTVEYGKPKDDEEEAEHEETTTEVVQKLEALAASGITKPRVQSEREQDWISRLVEKHGDNYEAMFWDKKLNIYQQSIGDLKRRIFKWKKSQKLA